MIKIDGDALVLSSGDGYYDINYRFPVSDVISLTEEVGVRGGHVGWSVAIRTDKYLKTLGQNYETIDMGRKDYPLMEELKELIKKKKLKIKILQLNDVPQKGW